MCDGSGSRVDTIDTLGGGALPAGIVNDKTVYWVCNKTANDFQIDATSSACGALITDFSGASGTNMVRQVLGVYNPAGSPTTNSWVTIVPSVSLSAATAYFAVLRNVNASPASNNFVISLTGQNTYFVPMGFLGFNAGGPAVTQTTNSGSTYGTIQANAGGFRMGFASGAYRGWPVIVGLAGTGDRPNGT